MRCLVCGSWSFSHICNACAHLYLTPGHYERFIGENLRVHSFYRYDEIELFLHTKHTDIGFHVYARIAKAAFGEFGKRFGEGAFAAVPVDDHVDSGYAHTALLAKALASTHVKPRYGVLRAKSPERYAGKSLAWRRAHPRRFASAPFKEERVILVDDIITTGTTLEEAAQCLRKAGKEVVACVTLATAL